MLLRQWLCLQWSVSPRHLCWCLFSDQMWSQCQMWKSPTFRTVYMPLWIHRKSSNCMLKMWVWNIFTFWLLLHVTYLLISFDTVGSPIVPGVTVGCDIDDDCPDYTACRNRKCINPCVVDKPCAPSANCRVVKHSPICTCPNGYIGTPQTKCSLREFWKTKSLMQYLQSSSFFFCTFYLIPCMFWFFSSPAWVHKRPRMSIVVGMYKPRMQRSMFQACLWNQCWLQSEEASANLFLPTWICWKSQPNMRRT